MFMAKEKIKIIPRDHWVLVKPVTNQSRETENGIILPAKEEQEQKAQGVVEAVGGQVIDLKKGQEVVYGAYVGENLKISEGGKEVEYKLLMNADIIALIER